MDKEKIKLIVRNMELLIDSLKAEIYSDASAHSHKTEKNTFPISDYDELYDDSDEY